MDWLKSSLAAAQKQAQEAAEKAKVYAQQATEQAIALAEQAQTQAKVLAEQAQVKAKELASVATEETSRKFQEIKEVAANVATGKLPAASASSSSQQSSDPAKFGISQELINYVSSLTYSTFSDYPMDTLPYTNPLGVTTSTPGPDFRLNPWLEKHAVLMLQQVSQLEHLRFALCPKRLSEGQFWMIYFTLTHKFLPDVAFMESAPPAPVSTAKSQPQEQAQSAPTNIKAKAGDGAAAATSPAAQATSIGMPSTPSIISPAGTEADLVDALSSGLGEEDLDHLDEDLDKLAELENDPELAAYLEEALNMPEGAGDGEGGEEGAGTDVDDLDDYINQLDAELSEEVK